MLRGSDKSLFLSGKLVDVFGGRLGGFPDALAAHMDSPLGPPPVAGYTSWWDGSDFSSFTLVGGSKISQWNDKGSGGNHLSQANTNSRPVLARHPSGLLHNRLSPYFAGCTTAQGPYLGGNASASDMTQTAFVVGLIEHLGFNGALLGCSADGGNYWRVNPTTGQLDTSKADTAAMGTQSNAAVVAGVPFLAVQVLTATTVEHILDGVSESDGHAQTFTAARTIGVGGSPSIGSGTNCFPGWLAEIVIYDSTLSGGDIALVSAYLKGKWGTP